MYTCIYAYMYRCVDVQMYRCIYAYMYICLCIYIYIYKYVNMVISYLPVVVTSSPGLGHLFPGGFVVGLWVAEVGIPQDCSDCNGSVQFVPQMACSNWPLFKVSKFWLTSILKRNPNHFNTFHFRHTLWPNILPEDLWWCICRGFKSAIFPWQISILLASWPYILM